MSVYEWTFRNWLTVIFFALFVSSFVLLCTMLVGLTSWYLFVVSVLALVIVIQWMLNVDLHASIETMLNTDDELEEEPLDAYKEANKAFAYEVNRINQSERLPSDKEYLYQQAKADYDRELYRLGDKRNNVANVLTPQQLQHQKKKYLDIDEPTNNSEKL